MHWNSNFLEDIFQKQSLIWWWGNWRSYLQYVSDIIDKEEKKRRRKRRERKTAFIQNMLHCPQLQSLDAKKKKDLGIWGNCSGIIYLLIWIPTSLNVVFYLWLCRRMCLFSICHSAKCFSVKLWWCSWIIIKPSKSNVNDCPGVFLTCKSVCPSFTYPVSPQVCAGIEPLQNNRAISSGWKKHLLEKGQ